MLPRSGSCERSDDVVPIQLLSTKAVNNTLYDIVCVVISILNGLNRLCCVTSILNAFLKKIIWNYLWHGKSLDNSPCALVFRCLNVLSPWQSKCMPRCNSACMAKTDCLERYSPKVQELSAYQKNIYPLLIYTVYGLWTFSYVLFWFHFLIQYGVFLCEHAHIQRASVLVLVCLELELAT